MSSLRQAQPTEGRRSAACPYYSKSQPDAPDWQVGGDDGRFESSKGALASVEAKVRAATRDATNQPLATLCYRLSPIVGGWVNYFRHGVSKATFDYLREFTWRRVICWLRHSIAGPHGSGSFGATSRGGGRRNSKVTLFDPMTVPVTRYRYRGNNIPTPWQSRTTETAA